MEGGAAILARVRSSAERRVLFLPHAVKQMVKPERMISTAEVRGVIERGEIIEDYPGDPRGHSCLMFGFSNQNRYLHLVCAPKDEYLAIITAYIPDKNEWEPGFRVRRGK